MLSRHLATTPDPRGLTTHAGVLTVELPSDQDVCVLVGRKVHDIRQALGRNQEPLGRSVAIRQGQISVIARGQRCPSLARLFDVARAIDVARLVAARADALGAG